MMTTLNRDAALKAVVAFVEKMKADGEYAAIGPYDRNRDGHAELEMMLDGVMDMEALVDAILAAANGE